MTANAGSLDALAKGLIGRMGRVLTVTWSIQTMSLLSMVMASPPQTYLGLISVIAMFLVANQYKAGLVLGPDILDDDVASTADNPKTLALDHTTRALANDSLIRRNGDTQGTSIVTKPSHQLASL